MMLWEIPHFSQPEVHLVLFVNVSKYMAFLWMQESRRGDHRWQEKAAKEVQMDGNYQVAKDFNPDDPSQPISAITHTRPGLRYNLVSKGFTQAWSNLEEPFIQTVMNICAPSYDSVVIVEAALKVFHGELCVGSHIYIVERSQERMEDHIISTLHQECLHKDLDPNQWVGQRAMMPRLNHNKEQLLAALATRRTAKGGRKHVLMTRKMSLRTPIMRNTTADMMVAHNTGIKPSVMRVETKVTDWDGHHYEEREYDTYSRDTGNRGRSSLTTSRSEECSAT